MQSTIKTFNDYFEEIIYVKVLPMKSSTADVDP